MPSEAATVQRKCSGRDDKGRFVKGNPTAFQPGQSGNPAGSARGPKIWNRILKLIDSPDKKYKGPDGEKLTMEEYLALKYLMLSTKTSDAMKTILNRESPPAPEDTANSNLIVELALPPEGVPDAD